MAYILGTWIIGVTLLLLLVHFSDGRADRKRQMKGTKDHGPTLPFTHSVPWDGGLGTNHGGGGFYGVGGGDGGGWGGGDCGGGDGGGGGGDGGGC